MKTVDRIRLQCGQAKKPTAKALLGVPEIRPQPVGVRRDAQGRLLPGGANLNPGGRPKSIAALAQGILERTNAWDKVERVLEEESTAPHLWWEVFKMVVERAHGKAVSVSVSAEASSEQLEGVIDLGAFHEPEDIDALRKVQRRFAERDEKRQLDQGVTDVPALPPAQ